MSKANKIELLIIAIVSLLPFAIKLPGLVSIANLVLWSAALLLLQSLVRDLTILWQRKRMNQTAKAQGREAACFCAESTVGILGILLGCILLFSRVGGMTTMATLSWFILALTVLSIGYFLKSYVLQWNPWKIVKDPDHLNIIVKWS